MPHPLAQPHLLITAGPTHEPIDAVRFIGNRSSGRLGVDLATAAAQRGWDVMLLLGPATVPCTDSRVKVQRFSTAADLEGLLREHFPACDVLVMAAAVADFRPASGVHAAGQKIRRSAEGGKLVLELESTPDLLAQCAAARAPGQTIIGFALEPEDRLMESAREKIRRKRVDAIVANPLRTMDAADIEATLVLASGQTRATPGRIAKSAFADWLLSEIVTMRSVAAATE